jgi:hypothetical protein
MRRVAFSPQRVAVIAANTFREGTRQRLPLVLGLLVAAMVGAALFVRDLGFGAGERRFLIDVSFGALALFGAVLAIATTSQLFFGEFERRTVQTVLAKPVRRSEYILGKLGGLLLLLAVFCVVVTAMTAGLLWWREGTLLREHREILGDGNRMSYLPVLLCGLVEWLRLGVLAALTLCVASYAHDSLFTMAAGFFALVAGHLQYLARDFYGASESVWVRGVARLLGTLLPDFQLFNVTERVTAGEALSVGAVGGIAGYAAVYLAVFSGLAVYCFRHREL